MKESADIVDSYEFHKANIEECKSILATLSPQYAGNQEQDKRMTALENDLADIKDMIRSLMKKKGE